MDTTRWRMVTWMLFASVILCGLTFAFGLINAPSCNSPCSAPTSGAARYSYEAAYRAGGAVTSTGFLVALGLFSVAAVVWLAATILDELRGRR